VGAGFGVYDVDPQVLARWREALKEYLSARAALVGQIERQGWRAPARAPATSYVDIVFDGPPGPDAPRFVEVETTSGAASGSVSGYSAPTLPGC
jgi:hypothetical protein